MVLPDQRNHSRQSAGPPLWILKTPEVFCRIEAIRPRAHHSRLSKRPCKLFCRIDATSARAHTLDSQKTPLSTQKTLGPHSFGLFVTPLIWWRRIFFCAFCLFVIAT